MRPTSGRRIGPVFYSNTEYRYNMDLLFQLRFIHCTMVSPFILHCFPFSLTGEQKVRNCWRGVDELYALYLLHHANGQIHVCLLLKLLPSTFLSCTDSSQPGSFDVETYMHILGLWFNNTAGAKITMKQALWSEHEDRLEDHFIMYWFTSQTTNM